MKKFNKNIFICALLVVMMLVCINAASAGEVSDDTLASDDAGVELGASGDTIYVDSSSTADEQGTQSNPYKTISSAVGNATGGETIFIKNGNYSESAKISPTKSMSFVGESQDGVKITSSSTTLGIFEMYDSGIALSFTNLTFINVKAGTGSNLPLKIGGDQDVSIINCSFIDCASKFGAFQVYTKATATIENIKIQNFKSTASAGTGGIYLNGNGVYNLKNIEIDNSTFTASSGQMQGIIYLYSSGTPKATANIENLIISNCNGPASSILRSSGNLNVKKAKIINNTVLNSASGYAGDSMFYDQYAMNITQAVIANNSCPAIALYKTTSADFTMNYCNFMDNTVGGDFTDASAGDYDANYNYWGSNKLPSDVTASVWVVAKNGTYQLSNGQPLTVDIPELPEPKEDEPIPEIIYVDGNKGLDSNNGDVNTPVKTIKKAVELAQEGNGKVIINAGTYNIEDIATTVPLTIGANGTVILDGNGKRAFNVKSGSLNVSNITFTNCNETSAGSIICLASGTSATIDGCIFVKNGAEQRNGLFDVNGATLTLTNSVIDQCTSHKTSTTYGGIRVRNQGTLYIDNCNITNNFNKYGFVYVDQSSAEIYNSNFIGNNGTSSSQVMGSAIYISGTATSSYSAGKPAYVLVNNCNFINNTAKGNKGSYYDYGGQGGAIYVNNNATLVIEGSYFENNVAESAGTGIGQGGVIYASAGNITITGTVFKDNVAENASVIYLKFYNGGSYSPWATTGNLDVCTVKDSIIISEGVAIFSDNANYTVDVNENFWNSNDDPSSKVSENIAVDNWVILNAEIDPTDAQIGDNVTVTAAFDLLLTDEGPKEYTGKLPDGILVTFTSTSGKLNEIVAVEDGKAVVNYTLDVDDDYITAVVGDAKVDIPLVAGIIFVSPDGNDTNVGTEAKPVATIAHAIEIAPKGKIIVLEGTYKTGNLGTISKDLTIIGVGKVVFDAENNNRILYVGEDANVLLDGITLINGYTSASESGALIGNSGNLTLTNCTLANSTSSKNGGAIYNAAYLTVIGCTFEDNKAAQNGGAIFTQAAGIGKVPTLTITDSAFTRNKATGTGNFGGGAIFAQQAADGLSISNSNFTANNVEKAGGGAIEIVNVNVATIDGCNFEFNTAVGEDSDSNYGGGAISFVGAYSDKKETLTITDSLFEDNGVVGVGGGAIYVRAATATVSNSILVDNLDSNGQAIYARVTSYVTPSVTANDNWWGSSESPKALVSNKVTLNRWAVLTVSNDTAFVEGANVTVTADINSYTTGTTSGKMAKPIVVPREVTIETSTGDIKGVLENGEFSAVYNVSAGLKYVDAVVDSQKENLFMVTTGTTVQVNNISAKKAERPIYTINVTCADGTIVNQGTVELFINGESVAVLNVENGTASYKKVVSFDKGDYEILAKYTDDEGLFEESFGTGTLKVSSTRNDYIYNSNFHDYFDEDGFMYTDIPYTRLYYRDNFNAKDLGIDTLTITAPMRFNPYSSFGKFENITFRVISSGVTINGAVLNIEGDHGAAFTIDADSVTLQSVTVNYNTAADTSAYGVYAYEVDNFYLLTSEINFNSNATGTPKCIQHAVEIRDCTNARVTKSTINAKLPACDVDYYSGATGIDKDVILAIGVQGGENVTITTSTINTDVTGTYGDFPTVDSIMADGVTNLVISKNTMVQTDFSNKGAGYSNVVDLYSCNNAKVSGNDILVNSTAGVDGHGSAYPIQLTGPYAGVLIDENTLTSISNGPTLGIYSQNYNGATDINITNNIINVTGLATNSSNWALVSGMELQDTVAKVYGNTIYSQSIGAYDDTNYLYGISYAQWDPAYGGLDHTYDIRDNEIFTEGKYAVYFPYAKDTNVIANNLHGHELWGNDAAVIESGEGNVIRNNYPPYTAEVIIDAPNAFKGYEYTITVTITNATDGNVTLNVNGKEFKDLQVVNGSVSQVVDFADLVEGAINNVTAVYAGSETVNPGEANATFIIVDGVITNSTFHNYFDAKGYLLPVPVGATLDFQGPFIGNAYKVFINQPVNIISSAPDNSLLGANDPSTATALFYTGATGTISNFNIIAGADYTNLTGLTFVNTPLFVTGAQHVTIDGIYTLANRSGVGSGTGFVCFRSGAEYGTFKNSFLQNAGNGGSSVIVAGKGASFLTVDNNYILITGNSGNIISSNTYTSGSSGDPATGLIITNNIIQNNMPAISYCYAIGVIGAGNLVENNTINHNGTGITTSYNAASGNNIYRNNTLTSTATLGASSNGIVENNKVQGKMTASTGSVLTGNVVGVLDINGANIVADNNTVNGAVTLGTTAKNTTFTNNIVNGLVTVKANDNVITGNEITSPSAYAIDLTTTSNNVVTDNKLSGAEKLGDEAVKYVEGKNNTVIRNGGMAIIDIVANNVFVVNNNTITITVVNGTGNVTVKVNNKEFKEVKLTDGAVTIEVNASDIVAGENVVIAKYNGDEFVNVGTANATFIGLDNVVTEKTFYEYFDEYGFLSEDVPFDELIFKGDFNKLSYYIYIDRPLKITSQDAVLKDMAIIIDSENVTIDGLTIVTKMELGDLISVMKDNATIKNMNLTYVVGDMAAYVINVHEADNVNILDNVIYFESGITSDDKYTEAIYVEGSSDVLIDGNDITARLPGLYMTEYDFLYFGMGLAYVNGVKIYESENVNFTNNVLDVTYNKLVTNSYPDIQALAVMGSENVLIDGNTIVMNDTLNDTGVSACLVGIQLSGNDNVVLSNNDISIFSNAGQPTAGTAYPISIIGSSMDIVGNTIATEFNGPNIGIFMPYGMAAAKDINITENNIYVVGNVSGNNNWGLVSGIEAQTGKVNIYNNTIEVANKVELADYVTGVSFVQNVYAGTDDTVLDIQNNTIITTGNYTVWMVHGLEANVTGNILYANELFGDDSVKLEEGVSGIVENNYPPFADVDVIVEGEPVWIGSNSTITVTVPGGLGNVTIKIGNKTFKEIPLVEGTVTIDVAAEDLVLGTNVIAADYNGDEYLLPSNGTGSLEVIGGVITNETYKYYFDGSGNLADIVPSDVTLDFQGLFLGKYPVYIDRPVNVISSTGDALFDSGATYAGNAINSFNFIAGADNSNMTGLNFINYCLYIKGASNVTVDSISIVANKRGVGSGTGFLSIHTGAYNTLVKNGYFENGGTGSSLLVLGKGGAYATFDHNVFNITGSSGNILSANQFVGTGASPEHVAYTNNVLYNSQPGSAFCYAMTVSGSGNLVENNTIYHNGSGILNQYGASSSGNIYRNNTLYGNTNFNPSANSIVENNKIYATTNIAANTTATGNTFVNVAISGTNTTFADNNVSGTVTVSGNDNRIEGNTIVSTGDYAVDLKSTTGNNVTGNYLVSNSYNGDAAVKYSGENIVENNEPSIVITVVADSVWIGSNGTVTVTVVNFTGNVTIKVNDKKYVVELDENGTATKEIPAEDLVAGENNVTATYETAGFLPVSENTVLPVLDGVITNETYKYYFDGSGNLADIVPNDVTLDFQGLFLGKYPVYIDKSVNVVSSTGDALFDAGATYAGNAVNSFNIIAGGDNTNITGLDFINYCLYIKGASNVTVDDISIVANKRGVGSGTGFLSIHTGANNTLVKNSYFENGGTGSSLLVLGKGGAYATFDHNVFNITGSSGNILSANQFVGTGAAPEHVAYTNNVLYNSQPGSAFCYAMTVSGSGNLVENNTIYHNGSGILNQYGATSSGNVYRNNTLYGNTNFNPSANSIVENNKIYATTNIAANTTVIGNFFTNVAISGTNTTFADNGVSGTVTVSGNNNRIEGNTIVSTGDYAVDLKSTTGNNVTDNVLYAKELVSDAAVKYSGENIVEHNYPLLSGFVVEAEDITVGEDAVINIKFNESVDGVVEVIVNGKKYNVDVAEGIAQLNVSDLPASEYTVGVYFDGNVKFNAAENSTEFTVKKLDTSSNLNITVPTEINVGDNVVVNISIAGVVGDIIAVVDGEESIIPLDENGTASVLFDDIDAGNHNVVVIYPGDETHAPSVGVLDFTVPEPEPSVANITVPSDIKPGDNATVDVAIPGATGDVSVIVDGKETVVPLVNGSASVPLENVSGGNHSVVVIYSGDKTHAPAHSVSNFTVPVEPVPVKTDVHFELERQVIESYSIDKAGGEKGSEWIVATLKDANGQAVSNVTVKFTFDGVVYDLTTDENGTIRFLEDKRIAQNYTGTFLFLGDETHNANMSMVTVVVSQKQITISASDKTFKASAKTKKYTITLKTQAYSSADGKAHMNAGYTVKLRINGKNYEGKTNSKGQVTFDLKLTKKGKYSGTIRVASNKGYKGDKKSIKITVK